MKRSEVNTGSIKINKFVIFSIILLVVLFVLFRMFGYIRLPALEALFPVSTSVTLILNVLLALFMLMKFSVDRKHLYLVVLAFAYGISSLYLMSKLLSYPGVIFTEGGIGTNANDLAIYFIFRSASMAIFFLLSLVVYRLWNNRFINMVSVTALCACLTIILLSTAYFVSSHSSVLSLPIVDEGSLSYQQFWNSSVGLYLVLLWGGTTCAVMWFAGVKNNFWASLSLSCMAFLGSTMLLSGSEYLTSLAWYGAHLFEVLATFVVMLAFLFDIFKLYQKARIDYKISYNNSIRDPMTRLYNRSYYYDSLVNRMKSASKNSPITLLVADIDHFKRINDIYGHITGDRVIQYVVKTLQDSIRKTDIAARIGGEEFSVMLDGVSRDDALEIAEKIRVKICHHQDSPFGQDVPERITISIGIYTVMDNELTAEQCVARADEAMYQAKQEGRDRVVIYSARTTQIMRRENSVPLRVIYT